MSKNKKFKGPLDKPGFKNEFEQKQAIHQWLKDTGKPANSLGIDWEPSFPNAGPITSPTGNFVPYVHCEHRAQCVLKGDGWGIHCGTGNRIKSKTGEFSLLLNCSNSGSYAPRHVIPIKLGDGKKDYAKHPDEIRLDWSDYDVPSLDTQFWYDLYDYIVEKKAKTLVFCVGGHGRTGTAMACLLVASGYTADESIAIVRENYCKKAIESKLQEQYVHEIDEARPERPKAQEAQEARPN
jgi:hypothetical protein